MESPAAKYSVFLTPGGEDFRFCDSLIREFGRRFGVPPFEPHVTIYSGVFTDPATLQRAVAEAVDGMGPLRLRVRGVDASAEFFKTLFIDFEDHEAAGHIRQRIGMALPVDSGYRFAPHLSLLYRDMPLADKRALAQEISLRREEMLFDGIAVATPGNAIEGWRDTGDWRTICRIQLKENP